MNKKALGNKDKLATGRPLSASFFSRSTSLVARELLGKMLYRRYKGKIYAYRITEVEIYDGFRDKASHASRGKTKRNAPMFGPAGHWYVYFTYGMHWMLNIATREEGYPAAILIRACTDENSEPRRSPKGRRRAASLSGPARLTKGLHIDGKLNCLPANKKNGLWVESCGIKVNGADIKRGPRIGVNYAGPYWAKRHWRLWISD